ncbi:hypothetical protein A3F55_00045 [Candidatus Adlerbacteria bacterium RIFCSPHIGHO2_12_FULL_53_18]|uniref:Uncharacterized protein n=1 Tax=Candidatus Adlerbacteria bacterium RIFCSPHIGHO2_12_FULL_53_18 TaxID=1797242 RepID=A0A1F4XT06_9BACT|nr:MAG: hypothetical protein A3F55_00045 [Candidatus Adlerbacteria bacterium RIFCSPHIGHO2_12_FULL_53_18]
MQGKPSSAGPDINFEEKPLAVFLQYYNQNTPEQFPRATTESLQKFKAAHAELFKDTNEWTIDKHRKKLMDWLTSSCTVE